MCKLYRSYLAMTHSVAADERDLDSRFERIMDKAAQQQQPHLPTAHPAPARCTSPCGRRRAIAHLAASALAGTGVAVAGYATRAMAGVVSLVVITVAATVTVFAVTAVGDHYVGRHKRAADTEHDVMTPSPLD